MGCGCQAKTDVGDQNHKQFVERAVQSIWPRQQPLPALPWLATRYRTREAMVEAASRRVREYDAVGIDLTAGAGDGAPTMETLPCDCGSPTIQACMETPIFENGDQVRFPDCEECCTANAPNNATGPGIIGLGAMCAGCCAAGGVTAIGIPAPDPLDIVFFTCCMRYCTHLHALM